MNIKQHKFVTEYLRFGDKLVAYNNAYPNPGRNGRTTESAANRLMQHPEVAQAINDAQETAMHQAREELKDRMKEELMTVYDKRLLLKKIALGEISVQQNHKGKNCSQCTIIRNVTIREMLAAVREDNRMAGHYKQQNRNIPQHIPPLKEVSRDSRTEDVHSHNSESRNISQHIPPSKEVPRRGGAEDVHSHSTKTHNKTQQPNVASSTSQTTNNNERVNTQHIPPSKEVPRRGGAEDVHPRNTNPPPTIEDLTSIIQHQRSNIPEPATH